MATTDTSSGNGLLWNSWLPAAYNGVKNWLTGWTTPSQTLAKSGMDTGGNPLPGYEPGITGGFAGYNKIPVAPTWQVPTMDAKNQSFMDQNPQYSASTPQVGNPVADYISAQHASLPSSQTGPAKFSVNTPDVIPSNYANGNISTQDVIDYTNTLNSNMVNGVDPSLHPTADNSNQINSNSAYNYYNNIIPGAYNMTPDQVQTYNDYVAAQQRINTQKWQTAKQIQDLYTNGKMTKDQADQWAQDIQRQADAQAANLTYAGQGAQLDYNTMQMVRQNNIAGVQAMSPYYAPMQVSPGNSIVSAGTGQPMYDPYGLAGTAGGQQNQFAQQSQGGQQQLNGWAQQPDGSYVDQMGYSISPVEAQKVATMPSQLQPYVKGSPLGVSYIDISQVPAPLQAIVQANAAKSGIKSLDQGGITALNAAQQILDIVDAAKALSIRNLASGTSGRITNTLAAWANNYLQNNPDLSNFDQLRDAASKATTALAGGTGSGFRMNMGIIEAAVNNLPRANDNLETALTKADSLATQIINGLRPAFPNVSVGNKYGSLLQSQYTNNAQNSGSVDWANLQ